jgi:hypothetical protein
MCRYAHLIMGDIAEIRQHEFLIQEGTRADDCPM